MELDQQMRWIVGLGEALFDCFPDRRVLGGAPLNVAFHASQLPLPTNTQALVVSRVGKDAMGQEVLDKLSQQGMSVAGVQVDSLHATGTVQVELIQGEPRYQIIEDVAWDYLEWTPALETIATQTAAVCYGSLAQRSEAARSTIEKFLISAKDAVRLYDINLRKPYCDDAVLAAGLPQSTMIKCNADELETLFRLHGRVLPELKRDEEWLDAIESLRSECGYDAIMVTRGPKGCTIASSRGGAVGEPCRLEPVPGSDPVGAGDATAAALMVGWIQGWPVQKIADLANRLGAFVASQPGATPQLPQGWIIT